MAEEEPENIKPEAATILETAKTDYDNERREANSILNNLKNPDEQKMKSSLQGYFRRTGEPEIDWFNFETRIRKVIYEVVEPLTKKQFLTFDGFDDIKKQMATMKTQQEETMARIDKVM